MFPKVSISKEFPIQMHLSSDKDNSKATKTFNKYLHKLSHFTLLVCVKCVSIQVQLPVCLEFLLLTLGREQLLKRYCNLIQFSRNVHTLALRITVCSCLMHFDNQMQLCNKIKQMPSNTTIPAELFYTGFIYGYLCPN